MQLAVHNQTNHRISGRFFKNLKADLFILWEFFAFLGMILVGFIIWILSFSTMRTILGRFILQPILIYLAGTYFTGLPQLVVIILAISPAIVAAPIIFIAMILTLAH